MKLMNKYNLINEHTKDILEIIRELEGNIEVCSFQIPLQEPGFSEFCSKIPSDEITSKMYTVFEPLIDKVEGYEVILHCNVDYAYCSFSIESRFVEDLRKGHGDVPIIKRWKVTATDGEFIHYRCVSSDSEDSAIQAALYSLRYDNRRDYTVVSAECLN